METRPSTDPRNRQEAIKVAGEDGAIQCASNALEVMSGTYGTRTCCFGTVMVDHRLYLWYYDACGIVYTKESLSLLHDFEKVAALIIALAGCTPERFGAFPTTTMKPLLPYPKAFPPPNLVGNSFVVDRVEKNNGDENSEIVPDDRQRRQQRGRGSNHAYRHFQQLVRSLRSSFLPLCREYVSRCRRGAA